MYKKIIRTTKEAILKNNKETNFNFELHDFILRTRMIISLFIIIENNILHLEESKKKIVEFMLRIISGNWLYIVPGKSCAANY